MLPSPSEKEKKKKEKISINTLSSAEQDECADLNTFPQMFYRTFTPADMLPVIKNIPT